MNTDKIAVLEEECAHLEAALVHLRHSRDRTRDLTTRDWASLSMDELERLESLASRFARAADMLIQRLLRLLDELELATPGSLLDRLYRAEKRGLVADARVLIRIRELRNLIAHEYGAEKLAEIYAAVAHLAPELDTAATTAIGYARDWAARLRGA